MEYERKFSLCKLEAGRDEEVPSSWKSSFSYEGQKLVKRMYVWQT